MIKRISALVICLFLIFALTACDDALNVKKAGEKPEKENSSESTAEEITVETAEESSSIQVITMEMRDYEYKASDGKVRYYRTHPEIFLSASDKEKYPELSSALEKFTEDEKEVKSELDNDIKEFIEEIRQYSPDFDMVLYDTKEVKVRRADDVVLCLQICYDSYSGGAHGMFSYSGVTFDTKTGKKLSLSDVVTDEAALFDAVIEELNEKKDKLGVYEDTDFREIINAEDSLEWTLENDSITVYFAPYQIAAFAAGAPTAVISASEYPGLIKEEYISTRDSFAVELSGDTFEYDITGDGIRESIVAYAWPWEDYETGKGSLGVLVNDVDFKEELSFKDAAATFIKTADGKFYVYMDVIFEDSAKKEIYCFELGENVKKAKVAENLSVLYDATGDGSAPALSRRVITSPESFFLEDSEYKCCEFRMGEDGLPEKVN